MIGIERPHPVHSHDIGSPWLCFNRRGFRSLRRAFQLWEPLACVLVGGILTMWVSLPMGTFIILGFYSVPLSKSFIHSHEKSIRQRLIDARFEQERTQQLFRE